MTKRERLEDIGRIQERLSALMEHEMFDLMERVRPKDFTEWFRNQTEEEQDALLHTIAYGVQNINFEIADIWGIARGEDE